MPCSRSPRDRRRSFRAEKRGYRGSSQVCPHCKKDAKFEGYRTLNHLRTLLGEVRFERAYYHCGHCGRGEYPGEKTLGIVDHQTPAHREVVTLVVIGLTDGGAGLEDCLLDAVSGLGNDQIVFILDIHHARDHLVEFACRP